MAKIISAIMLAFVVILIGAGVYHRKSWDKKIEIRDEALLYFHEEDYEKAIDLFEDARSRKTLFSGELDRDIRCYLAESYYQLGEYDQAVSLYEKMIRMEPENEQHYLLMGECLEQSGNEDEAKECYEKGYKNTKEPEFLLRLCRTYLNKKDYDAALSYARKGEEAGEETRQDFIFMDIIICERSGDYQGAYEAASRYIGLYPEDEKGLKEYTFLSTRID